MSGPILLVAIGIVLLLLVGGLVLVARNLNRGEPVLPPVGQGAPDSGPIEPDPFERDSIEPGPPEPGQPEAVPPDPER